MKLNKDDDTTSWFTRLKQFLQVEPQNKEQLIGLLRDAHDRSLIDSETLAMIEGAILFWWNICSDFSGCGSRYSCTN